MNIPAVKRPPCNWLHGGDPFVSQSVEGQFRVREVLFGILPHLRNTRWMGRVDVDVLHFVTAFHHVLQYAQASFSFAQIIIQADITDRADIAEQERAFFIGPEAVVLFAVLRQDRRLSD